MWIISEWQIIVIVWIYINSTEACNPHGTIEYTFCLQFSLKKMSSFHIKFSIRMQNTVPTKARSGGCVCACCLAPWWKFVPLCKPCPVSPTTQCEMWHNPGFSFKACLFCLCALHCVCAHCLCVCVGWGLPMCVQGGGKASIFTRSPVAAVHWHARGSVTVVIQGFRREPRRIRAVWSEKVYSHRLQPVQDLQPHHGGSVPVQHQWGEDCEGQPHQGDWSN